MTNLDISVLIPFTIKLAGHVITATIRALQIVIVMIVELFAFNVIPAILSWIGSGLVLIGVFGILFYDKILIICNQSNDKLQV